jgi:hypothetical protein
MREIIKQKHASWRPTSGLCLEAISQMILGRALFFTQSAAKGSHAENPLEFTRILRSLRHPGAFSG